MWPACINELLPFEHELKPGIPKFLKNAFSDAGIADEAIFIPIRPVALLGTCRTSAYQDCPNMPEHHIMNSQEENNPAEYFNHIGRYYWFDFDVIGLDGAALPLRMVFNEGDGDCNDGLWGAVWERNTEELVVNILSTGDSEATVEVVAPKYSDRYESQEIWVPTTFARDFEDESIGKQDPIPCYSMEYANDGQLEKFIGLAIRLCCLYTSKDTYTKLGYDR